MNTCSSAPGPRIARPVRRHRWAAALGLASLTLGTLALPAQAAAPATDLVSRSIETPFPSPTPFSYIDGLIQFYNTAYAYGLTFGEAPISAADLGSFQGSATGRTLSFAYTGVTATLTSSADLWARVQSGDDPIAFAGVSSNFYYVHVAALGRSNQDVTLLTLNFSRPIQGFAFAGAGISDVYGSPQTDYPSQRIRLDGGPAIDILGVNPNTVQNPVFLSFGIVAAQPFSTVSFILPAGSGNDNAALANLSVAVDLNPSPVPEPATWAMWLVGLAVTAQLSRRRLQPCPSRAAN